MGAALDKQGKPTKYEALNLVEGRIRRILFLWGVLIGATFATAITLVATGHRLGLFCLLVPFVGRFWQGRLGELLHLREAVLFDLYSFEQDVLETTVFAVSPLLVERVEGIAQRLDSDSPIADLPVFDAVLADCKERLARLAEGIQAGEYAAGVELDGSFDGALVHRETLKTLAAMAESPFRSEHPEDRKNLAEGLRHAVKAMRTGEPFASVQKCERHESGNS
ncbi:MAG: hypothetical protein ACLQVI_35610 [Polyangiaceae bacterium]